MAWLIVGFESLVKICLEDDIYVIPGDTNSDLIENYFCSQRGITGGARSNPSVHNYMYNANAIVLGTSMISTKSNAGSQNNQSAAPYNYSTPMPVRRINKKSSKKLIYEDETK